MSVTQVDSGMAVSEVLRLVASHQANSIIAYDNSQPAFELNARDLGPVVVEQGKLDINAYKKPLSAFLPGGALYVDAVGATAITADDESARASKIYSAVATKPLKYVCEAGHENPDPDTGRCYRCPRPIAKTQ